jgi:hypothetical protein
MGEEERGEDRSFLRGNSMTVSVRLKKGGHGTSLFFIRLIGLLGFWGSLGKPNKLHKPDELNEPRRGEL